MKRYYINGWREGRRHFLSYRFTEDEIARMEHGETVNKGGNEFRIEAE